MVNAAAKEFVPKMPGIIEKQALHGDARIYKYLCRSFD
jgi:hypothetical protein